MSTTPKPYQWLTAKVASEYLDMSTQSVRQLILQGKLKAVHIGQGRHYRTTYAWCDDYVRQVTIDVETAHMRQSGQRQALERAEHQAHVAGSHVAGSHVAGSHGAVGFQHTAMESPTVKQAYEQLNKIGSMRRKPRQSAQ